MKYLLTAKVCLLVGLLTMNNRIETMAQSTNPVNKVPVAAELLSPQEVVLHGGLLGTALEANRTGRLHHFITDEKSEMIAMFSPAVRDKNKIGDWKGEHAGKWLFTAARAAYRTKDEPLKANVKKVADYLISVQEPDGYLGTYSKETRMTSDSAYQKVKTWDVWVHSYLVLGFLEINRFWPEERYVNASKKIINLCIDLFAKGNKDITYMGNHFGLSSTILLEPVVELYRVTQDKKYLDFANVIVKQMENRRELEIISRNLKGLDASEIGDGKIYQVLWNYVALAKLYETTGNEDYLKAIVQGWQSIKDNHLTLGGGPWGGVAIHTEVFNHKGFFSPEGFVETCSIMSWIHLNRELLRLTGLAKYAEEAEKSFYNELIGAMAPDGHNWHYFSFPNGTRTYTFDWACCKSSGSMALEEITPMIYSKHKEGISINIYTGSEGVIDVPAAKTVKISQVTDYPTGEQITLKVEPAKSAKFSLLLRVPAWAENASIAVNNEKVKEAPMAGTFFKLTRQWKKGDIVKLHFPMQLQVHQKSQVIHEKHTVVVKDDYLALTRGPLVYATGLIDGYKREATVLVPKENPSTLFSPVPTPQGFNGPAFGLSVPASTPILFLPYYEAGGRKDGAWRATWMPTFVR